MGFITHDLNRAGEYLVCPACLGSNTESKGYRKLSTGIQHKRVCHGCGQYYYWKDSPYQSFFQHREQ